MEILKTSEEWYSELSFPKGIVILDPDGWDRSRFEYSWFIEKISEEEYRNRLLDSTCQFKVNKERKPYE